MDLSDTTDLDFIENKMKHKHKYSREHHSTMKTQLLLMNKIAEQCRTHTGYNGGSLSLKREICWICSFTKDNTRGQNNEILT